MDSLLLYQLFNNTPHLRYLSIGRNIEIDKLPKIEQDNSSLKRLEFTGNDLDSIPADIEKLVALEFFSCIGNTISKLPPGFSKLKSLNHLKLSGNHFTTFPEPILGLSKLNTLILSEKINEIPGKIHVLAELEKLTLISTHVSFLPNAFSKLKKLRILDLYIISLRKFRRKY